SIVRRAVRTFALLHGNNKSLSRDSLSNALRDARQGEIIVLHVAEQNSGLVIQNQSQGYLVESFEASPRSAEVLAAHGALEWDFPSRAVVVPSATFEDGSFQAALASFLEKASLEPVKQFAATTLKAKSFAYESRDTPIPAIVGQLLMSIFEASGRTHNPTLTRKRIRDEVCWSDAAENPWRRSATWLVLRVSIQRILCSRLGPCGTVHYKFFMCYLVATLCHRFTAEASFSAEQVEIARTKLARRLTKLETQRLGCGADVSALHESLLSRTKGMYEGVLQTLSKSLEERGIRLRGLHTKMMYRLPKRAKFESTTLSLSHSWAALNRIQEEVYYGRPSAPIALPKSQSSVAQYSGWVNTQQGDQLSISYYYFLTGYEIQLGEDVQIAVHHDQDIDLDAIIRKLRQDLRTYQIRACLAYRDNPEQLSIMLLTLMEIWVALDTLSLRLYPLLADCSPGFPDDLLNPLMVQKLSDMRRLHRIEQYLERRRLGAIHPLSSVLGEPTKTCFAVRYFERCEAMQELHSTICDANEVAKARKAEEWKTQSKEYERLMRQASETACLFIEDPHDPMKRQHDDRNCRKHFLEREAARMRIAIHEDFLPEEAFKAKAVVFELLLPPSFAAWRDSTWQLLTLARGSTITDRPPKLLLHDYASLWQHALKTESSISLASRTKSFHMTHYSKVSFPTQLDQVCLPHAMRYVMYDTETLLWTSRHLAKPSFATICCPDLPPRCAWISLKRFLHPTFNDVQPSGNEVVASQTRCPNNLTVSEFMSFQDLRIGIRIPWIKILRELSSSNINFGSLEFTTLITETALGAGPPLQGHVLRETHWVFSDPSFCRTLATCVRRRLQAVAHNWREGQTVECLMVLVQRLWYLGQTLEATAQAQKLLIQVRNITHTWIRSLRREICNASDVATAQKRSRESLHAALLCRKTFILEVASRGFEHAAFACFLECAFTIKDNLGLCDAGYIDKMPAALRRLYVSDLKLIYNLERHIRWSIEHHQAAVSEAVNSVWMDAGGSSARVFSQWVLMRPPRETWATARSSGDNGVIEQTVSFDIIEGTLYIGERLLGCLPDEFLQQDFFQEFFGNRFFLTRPSYLHGMSHMFVTPFEEHEIHFGFRNGVRFMRVRPRSSTPTILEYLPASIFVGDRVGAPDLPSPLIDGRIHWYDIRARKVEIRPLETRWRSRLGDWKIDLVTRQAWRRNKSLLVDPRSEDFGRIVKLIEPFESRAGMVVYQPIDPKGSLTVDLPLLELTFRVGSDGLLTSQQLQAYVDLDQNAGTLYGLRSSLVLRDNVLQDNRSVLVPIGPPTVLRTQTHVDVSIKHTGYYARFAINTLLGRLECAAEPRLLYFKAWCHAITSSAHPDPLTARTGTAEAVSCLQAANAQPWAPLDSESYRILFEIAGLTPSRMYYPENLKALQKVSWDDRIMPGSQSGQFRPIVEDILQQCAALHRFHLDSDAAPVYKRHGDPHLHARALWRSLGVQYTQSCSTCEPCGDQTYKPRDLRRTTAYCKAFEAASFTSRWTLDLEVNTNLSTRLQEWPLIQGFAHTFEGHLLSDLIEIDPASNWGSLFRTCAEARNDRDKMKMMFDFATIAFGGQMELTLLRTLTAIAIMEQSRTLELPDCTEFIGYKQNQIPTAEHLAQYIRPHQVPYPDDERALLAVTMHSKQRRKLEGNQRRYEAASETDCMTLTGHLISQWPTRDATVAGLSDLPLLDVEQAMSSVRPEWERLSDNFQLSKHLADVQRLLSHCRAPATAKTRIDQEPSQEWYPWRRPATIRYSASDLLFRPLQAMPSVDNDATWHQSPDQSRWINQIHSIVALGKSFPSETRQQFEAFDTKLPEVFLDISIKDISELSPSTWFNCETSPLIWSRTVVVEPPNSLDARPGSIQHSVRASETSSRSASELQEIIGHFARSTDPVRSTYGRDLNNSLSALRQKDNGNYDYSLMGTPRVDAKLLQEAIVSCRQEIRVKSDFLYEKMVQGHRWLELGGLLPALSPLTLLEVLRDGPQTKNLGIIQSSILSYAESLVNLQQLLRIQNAHRQGDVIRLLNERQNAAHTSWKPRDHIDWLLLELDFNLIIRGDQLQVAQAMIASPSTASNFVLQMNMGQGKSSVIIPMVAAALARDENLVRVVVPRSLLLQAAQLLSSRLGGLINRKLKHVPFSRKSPTDLDTIRAYHQLHTDVQKARGVLLALPEHLLSFQLSGLQELSNG
ncbi:MAG: hypothetical protein Q9183_002371, partial [Haloplaca sp. 2 TL-2023]